jgi:hypothetical protein
MRASDYPVKLARGGVVGIGAVFVPQTPSPLPLPGERE